MADFRRLFYALAVLALLAGLSVPVSAQAVIPPGPESALALQPAQVVIDFAPQIAVATTADSLPASVADSAPTVEPSMPIPRVTTPSCSVLFPYVVSMPAYDTGIAEANARFEQILELSFTSWTFQMTPHLSPATQPFSPFFQFPAFTPNNPLTATSFACVNPQRFVLRR